MILTLNYLKCPMLCTLTLNGLADGLAEVPLSMGKDYEVVTVSFAPQEDAAMARAKRETFTKYLPSQDVAGHWHFLTGKEAQIEALTKAVGFKYKWDPVGQQYAHPLLTNICTPAGHLSRYLYGTVFAADTLRLSLVEAGEGKIGTPLDQVILYCFCYNPKEGTYGPVAMKLVQIFGGLTVLVLALWLGGYWIGQKRRPGAGPDDPGKQPVKVQTAEGKH